MGNNGIAYSDKDYKNETGEIKGPWFWNKGEQYRNDGVDIQESQDPQDLKGVKHYNVGWIESDEWMKYTVNILAARNYDVDIRIASEVGGGELCMLLDDHPVVDDSSIPNLCANTCGGYVVPDQPVVKDDLSISNTGGW